MTTFQERMDLRKKNFKKGVDADESRRRREDENVQIRKQKRDAQLAKKRMVNPEEEDDENVPAPNVNIPDNGLRGLVAQLREGDLDSRRTRTQDLRRMVSRPTGAPLQECVDAGVVPLMIEFLSSDDAELQFEAAWVLTNIASGDSQQTQAVVDAGAVPAFLKVLHHGAANTQEQVVWALANIAGDSVKNRDMLLDFDAFTPFVNLMLQHESRITMLRNVTWAMSNLCRGKPKPPLSVIQKVLPYLSRLIFCTDKEVLSDALWSISYICDGGNDAIQAILESGAVGKIVTYLTWEADQLGALQPALRACGNIATGSDMQTTTLLQCGVLGHLLPLLNRTKNCIRKETVWLISNVMAGNSDQIQMVLEANLLPTTIDLATSGEYEVRKEAVWVLANSAVGGTPSQMDFMTQHGAVQALAGSLGGTHEVSTVICVLDALEAYFRAGETRKEMEGSPNNIYCGILEECGGLSKLEGLQDDANEQIYSKAMKLLENYFDTEADAETEEEAPSTFNFA